MKEFFIILQSRFQAFIDKGMELALSDEISRKILWHGAQMIFALSVIFALIAIIGALVVSSREMMFACLFGYLPMSIVHLWLFGTILNSKHFKQEGETL